MARKIINRREKRAEVEASERVEEKATSSKEVKKRTAKKEEAPRMKLYWGVFNQTMKRVALYDYSQRKQAEKKAEDLTKSAKSQHFVQRVKEAIQP